MVKNKVLNLALGQKVPGQFFFFRIQTKNTQWRFFSRNRFLIDKQVSDVRKKKN